MYLLYGNIPTMLTIKLQRTGRRKDVKFRFVVTESTNAAKSGKFLEIVGNYDPKESKIGLQKDRISYWLSQGVQTTDTVYNFLVKEGVVDGKKKNVLPKKSPTKKRKEK